MKNQLEKIYRKAALKLVQKGAKGPARPDEEVQAASASSGEASAKEGVALPKEEGAVKVEEGPKVDVASEASKDEETLEPAKEEAPQKVPLS